MSDIDFLLPSLWVLARDTIPERFTLNSALFSYEQIPIASEIHTQCEGTGKIY